MFKGTAVTYATPMKTKVLGVPSETIEKHGVVSQEVVESMAVGVRNLMEADFGVERKRILWAQFGSVWLRIRVSFPNVSTLGRTVRMSSTVLPLLHLRCCVKVSLPVKAYTI